MKFRVLAAVCILVFLGTPTARTQETAATPPARSAAALLTPEEIQLYKQAHTLIDWTPHQVRGFPPLQQAKPAFGQESLAAILQRVGQTNALLLQDFPQVSCDQTITSEMAMRPDGSRVHLTRSFPVVRKFRYIVTSAPKDGLPRFEEYRTNLGGNPATITGLFMISSDFVSIGLYLSAADQPDSNFRLFGTEKFRKRNCYIVGFAQDPERVHTVAIFQYKGVPAALLVQGLAWIDAETFQTLRVTTWLLAQREDIHLSSEVSIVDFYPVQPSGSGRTLWLPRDVTVEGLFGGCGFHSIHHYSNFKLFRVESTIRSAQ